MVLAGTCSCCIKCSVKKKRTLIDGNHKQTLLYKVFVFDVSISGSFVNVEYWFNLDLKWCLNGS